MVLHYGKENDFITEQLSFFNTIWIQFPSA